MAKQVYLKPNVIAEPLFNQWYAWSYLIPPATAARYVAQSHLKILESFVAAPQVHVAALKDPAMRGGPFIHHNANRADEIATLLAKTKSDQAALLELDRAIQELDRLLQTEATGASLEPLYAQIPQPLKGYVELVYDVNHQPSMRLIEGLLYRSRYYNPALQSIALYQGNEDARSFVLSTPRLPDDQTLHLQIPFSDARLDHLFRLRTQAQPYDQIRDLLELDSKQEALFSSFFTEAAPAATKNYTGEGIRIRYFGHACVLIETPSVSILCDPIISYQYSQNTIPRYTFADLPETIDYVLITHNHQDHIMFETLLQLRHKIQTIVVPKSNPGSLIDPSLKLILQAIGFTNVREIGELETFAVPEGEITGLPVLGEHGDLNIAAKTAYLIQLQRRSILCAADSNNIEPALYAHLHDLFGDLDLIFIGMECDGAPFTWAYAPLLTRPLSRKAAETRRLDGSNAERAIQLIQQFNPAQVYVYAMGQEPWLNYITSIQYTEQSRPIIESNRLIEYCRQQNIVSERLFGCQEIVLHDLSKSRRNRFATRQVSLPSPSVKRDILQSPPELGDLGGNQDFGISGSPAEENKPTYSPPSDRPFADQPIQDFLIELSRQDIRLWIDNPSADVEAVRLRCNAPKGTLTPTLQTQLKQRKPEIIEFLQRQTNSNSPKLDLNAEAVLDPAIHPPTEFSPPIAPPTRLLLTGATGFLGSFLLSELLHQTSAQIYCLVRSENSEAAFQKLYTSLSAYHLWNDAFRSRIVAIAGDLSCPQLGLSNAQFQDLAVQVDAIYHNGAWVHHASPYTLLKATNVLGTQEVLRLACQNRVKPVHFISTISVFPSQATVPSIHESDRLEDYPTPIGGYAQSKWVAERLVTIARDRGLPVSIYRPGPISGHSQTGVFNTSDFLYRLISGYVQLGSAPEGEVLLDILPVDYISRAIISLSQRNSAIGQAFHLLHPQPVSSNLLFDYLCSRGYRMQRIPYEQWRSKLLAIAESSPDHVLYPLVALFPREQIQQQPEYQTVQFDCQNTWTELQESAIDCPAIDEKLFEIYLSYLIQHQFLEPP